MAVESITCKITQKIISEYSTVIVLTPQTDGLPAGFVQNFMFQQDPLVSVGIGVHKYGAIMFPPEASPATITFTVNGGTYTSATTLATTANVGDTITFNKSV